MPTDPVQLEHLLRTPGETLNVELKRWIDPSTPEGAAKIVKACLALRNRNGGYLVIGVDDGSLAPLPCPDELDADARFGGEAMQDLISRHVSDPFPVEVVFVPSSQGRHPVVVVPTGVRTPVAISRPLVRPGGGELLRVGEVPFRTLNANGRVSTSTARPEDWRDIVEICFDNREADVAGFIRRHLSAVTPDILEVVLASTAAPPPALTERAAAFLDEGHARFAAAAAAVDVRIKPDWGGWEVGVVLEPPLPDPVADRVFLDRVYAANPSYSGWPVWLDLRGMRDLSPRVKDDGWETLAAFDAFFDVLDFYRFEPAGRLYARRPHFDDSAATSRGAEPRRILDPVSVLMDAGEALAVGLVIAQALGAGPDARLGFAWRWSGLEGRRLATFSPMELGAVLVGQHACAQPEVRDQLVVPASTSPLAVAPFALKAARRLFAAFDGFSVREANAERIVAARLQRRSP